MGRELIHWMPASKFCLSRTNSASQIKKFTATNQMPATALLNPAAEFNLSKADRSVAEIISNKRVKFGNPLD